LAAAPFLTPKYDTIAIPIPARIEYPVELSHPATVRLVVAVAVAGDESGVLVN
jgi:hypothetical protein